MGKIKKEKFYITGQHLKDRTTYPGEVELTLCYDTDQDIFFFDRQEIRKFLGDSSNFTNFDGCKTKGDAINVVKMIFAENLTETKFLKIGLKMPDRIYMLESGDRNNEYSDKYIDDPSHPSHIKEMISNIYCHSGIGMEFNRVKRLELNGFVRYVYCDKNWDYKKEHSYSDITGLIEWTEKIEMFLIQMQSQMDIMCDKVFKFFAAPDLEQFKLRMESNDKLLTN